METKKLLIPRRLDDPPKFFFWDFDVALVWMVVVLFGIMVGALLIPFVIACAAGWGFGKLKAGQARGYGLHVLYWHTPMTMGFKRTPASCFREFVG